MLGKRSLHWKLYFHLLVEIAWFRPKTEEKPNMFCLLFKIKTLTMSKGIVRKWRSWTCESAANIWCIQQQISTNGGNIQPLRILERLCSTHSSVNLQKRRALGAIWIHLDNLDRGWYLGRTVGSRFCSCKVALPNPNHYIFHAQAKKKSLQKCNPSPDKGLLQKPKNLIRGPSRYP